MSFIGWIILIVAISSSSHQQPTFFKNTFKGLNGVALKTNPFDTDEIRAVYYYDQTVAVVDLGNNNELHNCNLIEVYEEAEAKEVLRNLSSTTMPQLVSFEEMIKLMEKCELLDLIQQDSTSTSKSSASKNVLSLFNGILPGTKWCGTGDIAENYHDLGQEAEIDRCCRSHDLCPVKVRARQTRYNLTNYSIYTKSHCVCDEALYNCLKSTMHSTAKIMGQVYFNVMKVPCIEDVPQDGHTSIGLERQFIPVKIYY
ncbi:Phospholipase A2 isozymes PA3A/PA3B/PA5 [Habropoda laboriosa]|uniref:Phospholipase A2 n=1 Tax=Habropoda laboriosa TaxID=597456 RepID=A0A0L7QUZ3_9HYME|nr:PREDICTED: phospholipase A2-like [Habropoda laboriosa]KOC62458.1 Phospholipase A2 isozymes PA3A/PA3B/PA5 [Habropoda laboriosa]